MKTNDFSQYILSLPHESCKKRFTLQDDCIYYVVSGTIDIFINTTENKKTTSPLEHFYRMSTGGIFLGSSLTIRQACYNIIAISHTDSVIISIKKSLYYSLLENSDYTEIVSQQINQLFFKINQHIRKVEGKNSFFLPSNIQTLEIPENTMLSSSKKLIWIKIKAGEVHYFGHKTLTLSQGQCVPVSFGVWVETSTKCEITITELLTPSDYIETLENFKPLVLRYANYMHQKTKQLNQQRLASLSEQDNKLINQAAHSFNYLFEKKSLHHLQKNKSGIINSINIIADYLKTPISLPHQCNSNLDSHVQIEKIIASSDIHSRKVKLEKNWQNHFYGPMVVFTENTKDCFVVINKRNHISVYDPRSMKMIKHSHSFLQSLEKEAYYFYKSFAEKDLTIMGLIKYSLKESSHELIWLMALGTIAGLLALIIPIATGIVFDTVIPSANIPGLWQVAIAIITSAVAIGVFELTRNFSLLRAQGKCEMIIESSLWDKILKLPIRFFRNYTPGDLTDRASSFSKAIAIFTGTIFETVLSSMFSIFSFFLLFYYSSTLAIYVSILTGIFIIFTLFSCLVKYKYDRDVFNENGKILGRLFSFINGIKKIRTNGAEVKTYSHWANHYSKFRKRVIQSQLIANRVDIISDSFILFSLIIIFFLTYHQSLEENLSAGEFIAFYTAFNLFAVGLLNCARVLTNSIIVIPILKRVNPFLEAEPEVNVKQSMPKKLFGKIEMDHIYFRYDDNLPLVINDVSINIHPGQFAAIVGKSGSGKSTLLQLLLGFEKPGDGSIYYDNHDLSGINIHHLRQQIGSVIQNSYLNPGTILQNIIGESELTVEDAWQALNTVGLAEEINTLPMGIFTFVGERGNGLSNGLIQRLLIAKAIVRKPPIIFFDEATSTLDIETQQAVVKSINQLQVTRLVIAHRLDTIKEADTIFVMDRGKIVEQGNHDMLINKQGVFKDLVDRQIL